MDEKTKKTFIGIGKIVLVTLAVATAGTLLTNTTSDWYVQLIKPSFQPPAMWFGIVWSALYLMIAVSAVIVYLSNSPNKTAALILYGVNAALQVVWSFLFFTLQNPALAFVTIVMLIGMAVFLIRIVLTINKIAAVLLVPYLIWLIFAMMLNYSIYMLN